MVLIRSRHHKRYLFGVIIISMILLTFNTQLMNFEEYYTLEITKLSTPDVILSVDKLKESENVTKLFSHENLAADDQTVISYLQSLMRVGSPREDAYNLTDQNRRDSSRGQGTYLDAFFKGKFRGFFVEIGAGDGESDSSTLLLEKERLWDGLLIEPDPKKYLEILRKGRKSRLLNACVKTDRSQHWFDFVDDSQRPSTPCFWIESILLAYGVSKIDVLSVDVNGKEVDILQSFPFEKFSVSAVTVELHGKLANTSGVTNIMIENGFTSLKLMNNHILEKTDLIFVTNKGPI